MRVGVLAAAAAAWLGCTRPEGDLHRRRDDPRCLAVRGCPPSRPVPPCGPSPATPTADLASAADGDTVEVRGSLAMGEMRCSLALCPGRCCNECHGAEGLATGKAFLYLIGDGLALRGDDSKECFGTGSASESVVARGKVRREHDKTLLMDATVCIP